MDLTALNTRASSWSPQQILGYALTTFGGDDGRGLVIASSFSEEDVIVIYVGWRISRRFRIVTLDTGRLHPETYDVMEQVRARYGVTIEAYFPKHESVEQLVTLKGLYSFKSSIDDRKECCGIRKVEPLKRALHGARAWATGLRAAQSVTRSDVQPFEVDAANGGIVKVNPLWRYTDDDMRKYRETHKPPLNALHAQGFPSIGCAPCTRAIAPGEDIRAGRWWWESPEHKECGLHERGAHA